MKFKEKKLNQWIFWKKYDQLSYDSKNETEISEKNIVNHSTRCRLSAVLICLHRSSVDCYI